jgi:hypothetical protein
LHSIDSVLEKVLQTLRRNYKDMQSRKLISAGGSGQGTIEYDSNSEKRNEKVTPIQAVKSGKSIRANGKKTEANNLGGISDSGLEAILNGINSIEELRHIKDILQTPIGQGFNTNVLRIALNMQEEKIASILVADYAIKIDEELLIRGIKTGQIDFL